MTAVEAMTDATERSRPPLPVKMTNVCPMLTIPNAAAGVRIFFKFWAVKKAGERIEEKRNRPPKKINIPYLSNAALTPIIIFPSNRNQFFPFSLMGEGFLRTLLMIQKAPKFVEG